MDDLYILVDGKVVRERNALKWAEWFEGKGNRIIARTFVSSGETRPRRRKEIALVSTVFLGLDHNYFGGIPILFETMIFGGPLNDYQERYYTIDAARRGHNIAVAMAREAWTGYWVLHGGKGRGFRKENNGQR